MEHFQHQVDLDTVMPGYPPGIINPPEGNRYLRRLDEGLLYDAANPRAFIVCGNNSEEVHPQERLAIIADDPDNRILECAVAGQADFIISGDHHLIDLDNHGIKIVTPARFLELIGR